MSANGCRAASSASKTCPRSAMHLNWGRWARPNGRLPIPSEIVSTAEFVAVSITETESEPLLVT